MSGPASINYTSTAAVIGYKTIVTPGLTIMSQLGGGVRFLHGRGEASQGDVEASSEQSDVGPMLLLNFNLGWSF